MRLQVGEFDRQARAFAFLQLVLLSVIMVGQKVFEGDDFGPTKSNLRHGCRQTFAAYAPCRRSVASRC